MSLQKEYDSLVKLNKEIQELGESLLKDNSISESMKKLISLEMGSNKICLDCLQPLIEKENAKCSSHLI